MKDDILEAISEQIHTAWMAEKQWQGFADHPVLAHTAPLTEQPDEVRFCDLPPDRHHPDMLPYADLAEHVKNYDRVTARAAIEGIEAAGYRIVKAD